MLLFKLHFYKNIMLKLHTPKNMNGMVEELLIEAGKPIFYVSEDEMPRASEEHYYDDANLVLRLRSGDIPIKVRQYGHIGLVGSDWYKETKLHYPGMKLVILDSYEWWARKKFNKSFLELVVRNNVQAESTATLPPSITSTEYEYLAIDHYRNNGWEGRIVKMGENGAPQDPKEYIQFCEKKGEGEGYMGLDITHGSIGELVSVGGHYGFMVSETEDTKRKFGIKAVALIEPVRGLLIADPDALKDRGLAAEIYRYRDDLRRAYDLNFDPEVHRRQMESQVQSLLSKER